MGDDMIGNIDRGVLFDWVFICRGLGGRAQYSKL
jgi:hypothetical protein